MWHPSLTLVITSIHLGRFPLSCCCKQMTDPRKKETPHCSLFWEKELQCDAYESFQCGPSERSLHLSLLLYWLLPSPFLFWPIKHFQGDPSFKRLSAKKKKPSRNAASNSFILILTEIHQQRIGKSRYRNRRPGS